jgi:hypothetical protein
VNQAGNGKIGEKFDVCCLGNTSTLPTDVILSGPPRRISTERSRPFRMAILREYAQDDIGAVGALIYSAMLELESISRKLCSSRRVLSLDGGFPLSCVSMR